MDVMNLLVQEEYYNSLLRASFKVASLRYPIIASNAFKQNVRHYSPRIADTSMNEVSILMCIDVIRCSRMMGVDIKAESKESFGIRMLCFQILSSLSLGFLKTYEDWLKASTNLLVMVDKVLAFESQIIVSASDLIIPAILGDNDTDNKNQYLIRLYRWASLVAKADGTITEQEQFCLSNLLKTTNSIQTKESAEHIKQDTEQVGDNKSNSETVINPYKELESLIGLDSVKSEVLTFINFVKVQQARKANGMKTSPVSYHCIFTGNPGTGKTTVARILASIYKDLGIIKGGQLIETDRSGLIGEYIGSTAIKTNRIIDKAIDGVLFIDEAYALSEGGSSDFGKEAIATLIKRMEDNRDRLVVILAGYPNNMELFLNSNPGIQSRISRMINFPDYSESELVDIFLREAEKYEYTLSLDGIVKLNEVIENEYLHKSSNFGNARFVRNLFERTIEHQANRLTKQPVINSRSLAEITGADIY